MGLRKLAKVQICELDKAGPESNRYIGLVLPIIVLQLLLMRDRFQLLNIDEILSRKTAMVRVIEWEIGDFVDFNQDEAIDYARDYASYQREVLTFGLLRLHAETGLSIVRKEGVAESLRKEREIVEEALTVAEKGDYSQLKAYLIKKGSQIFNDDYINDSKEQIAVGLAHVAHLLPDPSRRY